MNELITNQRNLPHWFIKDSFYFITFNVLNGLMTKDEQLSVLEHAKGLNKKMFNLIVIIIIPDHVHAILQPINDYSLTDIMKKIKGVTSRLINKSRKATGQFWQHESYDHIIRNNKDYEEHLNYIYQNPVKKGFTNDVTKYHGFYWNDDYKQ